MDPRRGIKIIWGIATVFWLGGVLMVAIYSELGPGTFMGGGMIAITWALIYFTD